MGKKTTGKRGRGAGVRGSGGPGAEAGSGSATDPYEPDPELLEQYVNGAMDHLRELENECYSVKLLMQIIRCDPGNGWRREVDLRPLFREHLWGVMRVDEMVKHFRRSLDGAGDVGRGSVEV